VRRTTEAVPSSQDAATGALDWSHEFQGIVVGPPVIAVFEGENHPCQASRASIETICWLRAVGYNAVSA